MILAIFSAVPQELRPIIKSFESARNLNKTPFKIFLKKYSSYEIIFVQTGMGIFNAESALKYVLEKYNPDFIISLGFGGALYNDAKIGDVIWASRVFFIPGGHSLNIPNKEKIFYRLRNRTAIHKGDIVTLGEWMKKSEIEEILPSGLSLPVCDMETFPLAKISLQKGLPFVAFRSITDKKDDEIPVRPSDVSDSSGHYSLSKTIYLLLKRPNLITEIIKLGRYSKTASNNLCSVIDPLIDELTSSL